MTLGEFIFFCGVIHASGVGVEDGSCIACGLPLTPVSSAGGTDYSKGSLRNLPEERNIYLPLAASLLPAEIHSLYFHSEHLLVRHRSTSKSKCGNGHRFGPQGGQCS